MVKIKPKNKNLYDPFQNYILDEYEQGLEEALEKTSWKSRTNIQKRKKDVELIARNFLDLRKSKRVTFRIAQSDLIRLKTKAQEKCIPYQTLLTALIRDYINGKYSLKL